ncbi:MULTISPECIES: winged helix-turn-helix domain-containing protein [unclassified Streptomyces]|uniref:winged helix-turn-helix domain-containing protein n=1 Tax=unclassified Streptomyces TaxID=2593676 RepID=UPI002E2D54FD|nr:winged helix-turn-helix domain-containing protein [Streptomyces sp. NBC_00223]
MSNVSHFQTLPTPAAGSATANRQRLRAVRPDEVPPAPDFLPPGATWLPAPGHVLPTVAGGAPMVGYLVLVPADQALPEPAAVTGAAAQSAVPSVEETGGTVPVRIDGERRTAVVDGRPLDLTYLEFELLAHLVAHPHRVHSRDQLVTTVWGYGHVGDGRTVDVHIARLRRKLGAEHRGSIVTVRRVGYKYAPAHTAPAAPAVAAAVR